MDDDAEDRGASACPGVVMPGLPARFVSSALDQVQGAFSDNGLADQLCRAACTVLSVDAVAICVFLGGSVSVPVGASDERAATAEAVEFTCGEGPCLQTRSTGGPVLVADIGEVSSQAWSLWPAYCQEFSRDTDFRAVYAFPLLAAGLVMGSLNLYRCFPGPLDEVEGVREIAAQITGQLLNAEMFSDSLGDYENPWLKGPSSARREQVWIAQGMIMRVNRVGPATALALLRAVSHSAGRLVDDMACDIVGNLVPVPRV